MIVRRPDIPGPVAPTRRPALRLPSGATDCHAHVFGPQDRYPLLGDTHFVPRETPWSDYSAMLRSIGCERAVLVQPSVYGTDNTAIEDALSSSGDIALRAVAVVETDVTERELERLHGLGFRGVRINVAAGTRGLTLNDASPLAERIRGFGWHLQVYADFHRNPEVGDLLAALPVPVVVDHFGRVPAQSGAGSPGFRALLRFMARDDSWVKLSAPYFISAAMPGYTDVAGLAEALVRSAPDRVLWGTDWPHASAREKMQADADLVDLLATWIPDEQARYRLLVGNPARLYGFP
ncbi:GntR family transcriptional regulator [Candidimonas nitroreducens]|uniref:GntR family transcriptional regulator n=1 Tax=Candidimonas nitroreducens TaxID=683354 RepID=A0A225MQU5_9BURK|nr:GntR family transcriptional regulator [Candidimonas nitroreducens]